MSASGPDQEPIAAPAELRPVPPALSDTRTVLHRLAETEISPARQAVTGRIGLRAFPGGFGTPPFGAGEQLRVEVTELVRRREDGSEERTAIAGLNTDAAAFLADWFAFGAAVLLRLRDEAGDGAEPSLVQLWPEHFDIAVELGAEAAGARATYGFSPGDEAHGEPYAYVSTWAPQPPGPLWNATAFPGAELGYGRLRAAADPVGAALDFLRERLRALSG